MAMGHKLKRMNKKTGLHSLRLKIFAICMVITNVMVFANAYVLIQKSAQIISENAYSYIYESMRHAGSNFDIFMEDAMSMSLAVVSNRDIVINTLLENEPEASYEAFLAQQRVEDYLDNMVSNKSHIVLAAVIGADGRGYKSSGSLILKNVIDESWFTETSAESKMRVFYSIPGRKQIALSRPIRYNGVFLGVALIEMDYETLDSVYSITPLEDAKIATFSQDGGLVFSNYSVEESAVSEADLDILNREYQEGRSEYTTEGETVLVAKHTSAVSGLTSIGLVSYKDLMLEAMSLQTQSFANIFFSIVASTVAAWLFAQLISKNIYRLQESMMKIGKGDFSVRAKIRTRDEIGVMAEIFNNMMDRIAQLMQNIQEKERQKRKAEQDALETQIQPHFIYNTINSITYVAHMQGQLEIEEVSHATVQLLRGVLGVRESFIALWQECEYIKQYVTIQRFKTQNTFTVNWEVEPQLWGYKIPKLLLQPIVENALIHGIYHMDRGQVDIQITELGDRVIFRVTDNGKGISPIKLDEIRQGEGLPSQFRKVGFANVRSRVKAIYGDAYDVEISSVENAFTCVEISLPNVPEESGEINNV